MTDKEMETILRQSKDREEMEKTYASAGNRVRSLMEQYGRSSVLEWLRAGVPGDLPSVTLPAAQPPQH